MILVSIASLVIILGVIFFTVMYYNAKPGNPSPASSPTASSNGPTTTGPTVGQTTPSSDATAIYNSLIGKLSPTTHHVVAVGSDTAWQGWPYTPERQAFVWHDNNFLFEIAAYSSSNEVVADINYNATTQGTKYQANAIGTCMFLYDSGADSTTPADYFRLLANEQGCQS